MSGLSTRVLGSTGLEVTELGFGGMDLRGSSRLGAASVTPAQAEATLNAVLDSGINYIDASIDYGTCEEFIGQYISHRRDEFFIASKCGCVVDAGPVPLTERLPHSFDRQNMIAGVDQSLRRMNVDHLDIVELHQPPSTQVFEQEGVIETLLDLQRDGKVRFIGCASTPAQIDEHLALGVFDTFQLPYSARDRSFESAISQAAGAGAGVVGRGAVGELLAGWDDFAPAGLDEVRGGMSRLEFLLRFAISHPDLATTLVGTADPGEVRANAAALGNGPLPPDMYAAAQRALGAGQP